MDVVFCAAAKRDLPSQIHRAFHTMARAQVALYRRFARTLAEDLVKKVPPAMVGAADAEKAQEAAGKIIGREVARIFKPLPAQSAKLIEPSLATIYMLAKTWSYRQGLGIEEPGDFTESTPGRFGHTGKGQDPGIYIVAKAPSQATINVAFNAVDKKAIAALMKTQRFWMTRQFIEDYNFSQRIRAAVRNGVYLKGLPAKEVAENLRGKLDPLLDQIERTAGGLPMGRAAYVEFLTVNTASVAKTYGSISGLAEAGVTTYTIINPLDERTCPVCSFMEGTVYQTKHGVDRIEALSGMDPAAMKESWPWMSSGADVRSVAGSSVPGSMSPEARGDVMGKAGRSFPPYHGRCRCVVAAGSMSSVVWDVGTKPPVPPKPKSPPKPKVKKPRKAKKVKWTPKQGRTKDWKEANEYYLAEIERKVDMDLLRRDYWSLTPGKEQVAWYDEADKLKKVVDRFFGKNLTPAQMRSIGVTTHNPEQSLRAFAKQGGSYAKMKVDEFKERISRILGKFMEDEEIATWLKNHRVYYEYVTDRAGYNVYANSITARDARSLLHEFGHHLEYAARFAANPELTTAQLAYPGVAELKPLGKGWEGTHRFLKARTKGEQWTKLKRWDPQYEDWEKTKPDKFRNPYTGKHYDRGSTEGVSMGVECLLDEMTMRSAIVSDPEHFAHTISFLAGAI